MNDAYEHVAPAIAAIRGMRDPIRHLDPRDERALGRLAADIKNHKLPEVGKSWDEMTDHEKHVLLARFANRLDDLPHDKFHMPEYCAKDATEHSCGSAGCAAGWAATFYSGLGIHLKQTMKYVGDTRYFPVFRGFFAHNAFAYFFAIPKEAGEEICTDFMGYEERFGTKTTRDITPFHAAATIRGVLARIDPAALTEANTDTKPSPVQVAEQSAQSARTLSATRARMPELDDEPGQCVLCGECPCSCESDPDLARDRELDMDERAAAD